MDNPPGKKYISGSQDSIGLIYPGISMLEYNGDYWPYKITNIKDKKICEWLEKVVHLIPLFPRPINYDPLQIKNIQYETVKKLGESGRQCYDAIMDMNLNLLRKSLIDCMNCWKSMFPRVLDPIIEERLALYPGLITGAGGGGYIIYTSDSEVQESKKIKVRDV